MVVKRNTASWHSLRRVTSGVLLAGLLATVSAPAADSYYRTNVNPALLYWQLMPSLPKDPEYLKWVDSYPTAPLDARYKEFVQGWDFNFAILRRAAAVTQACDWGIDSADGPETRLPHLPQVKSMAKAGAFRARYFLSQGKEDEAVQDLVAVTALARRLGNESILISALVQYAMESMVADAIAENFYAFSPEGLRRLVTAMDAIPLEGSISQCIGKGERSFVVWYTRKIEAIQRAHSGHEAAALAAIRELFAETVSAAKDYTVADQFIAAGGGTSEGVLKLIRGANAWYEELQAIAALPYAQFYPANQAFFAKVAASTNPFVVSLFPALEKARGKEFRMEARRAMLRAALAYRLRGAAGVEEVKDPFGTGPLGYRRFEVEKVDRGFELRTAGNFGNDFTEVCIFVEKPGAPFRSSGPKAGKAYVKP